MQRSTLVFTCVALGGAIGAVARHGITLAMAARGGGGWPGTLAVNLLGCFLIGVAWRFLDQPEFPPALRALLVSGLLGAFTTFSAFGLDALSLLESRRPGLAAAYLLASVGGGLLLVVLGRAVAAVTAGGGIGGG
ncbi:MAG: fluoride efflux transporter CrcB [Planctomycetota bacterium]